MQEQLIGQILAEKYRLEELIRETNLGRLYLGTHIFMNKRVLIKLLPPALAIDEKIVERFAAEAKTVSKIENPHVLGVTDYETDERGFVFLVMEHFDGSTLKDTIRQEGVFSLERTAIVMTQVCNALEAVHAEGIVHRDLKSESILLVKRNDGTDFVKVLDFGMAGLNTNTELEELNIPNLYVGTPEYMSPEQCQDAELDSRSDIYSLGIILFEMLSGKLPFTGEKPSDVMIKHVQEIPPSVLAARPELPPIMEQIVQRALAKQPVQRYQTATDFSDALNRVADVNKNEEETIVQIRDQEIPSMTAQAAAGNLTNGNQNNIWKTAFIVLAGISLLSAAMFYYTYGPRTDPSTALTTDANSQPVQPMNPPTGLAENQSSLNSNTSLSNTGVTTIDPNAGSVIQDRIPDYTTGYGGGSTIRVFPNGPSTPYPTPLPGTVDPNLVVVPNPLTQDVYDVQGNSNTPTTTNKNSAISNSNVNRRNTNANVGTKPVNNNTATTTSTPQPQPKTTPEVKTNPDVKPTPEVKTTSEPKPTPVPKPTRQKQTNKPNSTTEGKSVSTETPNTSQQ
jgi:serine/threonine-protein kinase